MFARVRAGVDGAGVVDAPQATEVTVPGSFTPHGITVPVRGMANHVESEG